MALLMIFMSLVQAHEERSKVSTCPNPNNLMALACKDWAIYLQGEGANTFSEGVSSVTNVPTVRLEATVGSKNIIKAIRGWRAQKQPLFFRNVGLETVSHCV